MGSKKKGYEPESMKELEDLFYNPDRYEDRKKYENGFAKQVMTESFERKIIDLYKGNIEKIKEVPNIKTPDFISKNRKIIVEATSISMPSQQSEQLEKDDIDRWRKGTKRIDKINEAINHAIEKNYQYLGEKYGYEKSTGSYFLVVDVDCRIEFFYNFFNELDKAVSQSIFNESGLDGIIFITESSDISKRIAILKKGSKLPNGVEIPLIEI
ncbi:MAG: hypothetical protein A4E32_00792 [Methanomassiliicoccales archaeon PtaU1.Bin124]|nr:MAG: hypothetical protein A4E32_00792 [Methanomassiliicoccales archaeon PtaU1.Bin124]